MARYTYALINNGREIDDLDADTYATEQEAQEAGEAHLDDMCPPRSPHRKSYRVETRIPDGKSPC